MYIDTAFLLSERSKQAKCFKFVRVPRIIVSIRYMSEKFASLCCQSLCHGLCAAAVETLSSHRILPKTLDENSSIVRYLYHLESKQSLTILTTPQNSTADNPIRNLIEFNRPCHGFRRYFDE